jgi:hypothetical protein
MHATQHLADDNQILDDAVAMRMAGDNSDNKVRRRRIVRRVNPAFATRPTSPRGGGTHSGRPEHRALGQYEFFIDDDRYEVIRGITEAARSLASAQSRAAVLLCQSTHRRKVMVYRDREYLCTVTPVASWPSAPI